MANTTVMCYPPILKPHFMGPEPPTKLSASLYEGGSVGYFKNYRNSTISRVLMPTYDWGFKGRSYTPRPDVRSARNRARSLTVPRNDITTIDVIRMREVDDLFKGVQAHRDQYKDHSGKLHPLVFFKQETYNYQCAPSMTSSYTTKYPLSYAKYKAPVTLPLTYGRRKETPLIPDLALTGIYNRSTCIAYKP